MIYAKNAISTHISEMYQQITKQISEFDKLYLSNNISKFKFKRIIHSKVIAKNHSALKDMPTTALASINLIIIVNHIHFNGLKKTDIEPI